MQRALPINPSMYASVDVHAKASTLERVSIKEKVLWVFVRLSECWLGGCLCEVLGVDYPPSTSSLRLTCKT